MRLFLATLFLLSVLALAGPAADAAPGDHGRRHAPEGGAQSGQVFRDCPDCPEMVVLPSGHFTMGSPVSEHGRFDAEGPQHPVSVHAFALSRYPVTVEEFAKFVQQTGYDMEPCDWPQGTSWNSSGFAPTAPVVCVSWTDARAYVAWLNGKLIRPGVSVAGAEASGPYRLPSEAEWEYAARAGTTTAHWWGEAIGSGNAVCNGCGSPWDNRQIAPVGNSAPNPFGLYDMLGNVWQWTADCWNESYAGAPSDGSVWRTGDCGKRVLRGGSWSNLPKFVRSAARNREDASRRSPDYASYTGFRVAKTLP